MIYVPIGELKNGDRLAQHVYRADGRLVLARGATITAQLIEGLRRLNVSGVYVDNTRVNEVAGEGHVETLSLRDAARIAVKEAFDEVASKGGFNSRPLIRMADDLIRKLNKDQETRFHMKEFRTDQTYLVSHSANVCMLAVLTGRRLGYGEQQLRVLALGALMHDIGYVSPLAEDPKRDHPRLGFDLLRKHPEIPLLSAHIVLQHHEMLNGQGYPMGVRGEEFREAAQIVAVANDFDHFVNEIGKKRLPHEGIEYVMSKVDSSYDINVVRAFVQSVVPYPVGTTVKLSNGMVGTVTELHSGHPSRPVIVTREHGLRFDLMHFQTEFIDEVIVNDPVAAG